MNPLVSVIIPNYNYARFLEQRIDSVLHQTYRNIEVIILDDCSTDNSREVIERYRKEPKIKSIIYNEANSGSTFKQWERGFREACGEFIWIAECDDYAEPTFLEEIVGVLQSDASIKIGFSNSYWITPERTFLNKWCNIGRAQKVYKGKRFVQTHMLKGNFIYNASMVVFRRDALKDADPDYRNYKSCGDKLFWISMASMGKVFYLCKPLNHFRIHSEKVTSKSIANGVLFEEEHKLFIKNVRNGYISLFNRAGVVSYFLRYVESKRQEFLSESVYKRCLSLWQPEADYRNRSLPFVYRLWCRLRFNKQQLQCK